MGHLDPMLGTMIFAIAAGIGVLVVARKMRFSAIALLLLIGIVLGPALLGIINPSALGLDVLNTFISLAVAIILFEGGLTLDYSGYKQDTWIIRLLLTVGVVITWMGAALSVWFIFGYSFVFSMLAGSLVIVTGSTVIAPLLKRIRVKEELHQIIMWEGVLIDPIGVFIAILCFEIIEMESIAIVYKEGFRAVGKVFALTDNEELNALICDWWATIVKERNTYRWIPGISDMPENRIFAGNAVWQNLPKPNLLAMVLKMGRAYVFTTKLDRI